MKFDETDFDETSRTDFILKNSKIFSKFPIRRTLIVTDFLLGLLSNDRRVTGPAM